MVPWLNAVQTTRKPTRNTYDYVDCYHFDGQFSSLKYIAGTKLNNVGPYACFMTID